jgi:predicted O-linked N-acetylglucosamine transferase (SPINDLY family)
LLTAVGHPEWVAGSRADYIRIALALARDGAGRAALRTGLREAMRHSPLLDYAGQADRLGAALRSGWRDWCGRSRSRAEAELPIPA